MYTQIWKRVRNLLNVKFDSKPDDNDKYIMIMMIYYDDNDKYIKTKIQICADKVNTSFQGKKLPKENNKFNFLSLEMLDSVVRTKKKYYPQTLLEE